MPVCSLDGGLVRLYTARKSGFDSTLRDDGPSVWRLRKGDAMFSQEQMMEIIQKRRGDAVIVTVERASVAWPQISTMPARDISPTVMGKGSSFALGVCLAQPDTKVIVFDGDGSLLMNLGTLTTVGNMKPKNLYHFVLENGMYATTGGQPIPGQNEISFSGMARESGYVNVYDFDDLEEFDGRIDDVLEAEGPALICVKTTPNPRLPGQRPQEHSVRRRTIREAVSDLQESLAGG